MKQLLIILTILTFQLSCTGVISSENDNNNDNQTPPQPDIVEKVTKTVTGIAKECGVSRVEDLAKKNSFSRKCRAAIQDLLPKSVDNLQSAFINLGSQKEETSTHIYFSSLNSDKEPPVNLSNSNNFTLSLHTDTDTITLDPADFSISHVQNNQDVLISISTVLDYSGSMFDKDIDVSVEIFQDLFTATSFTSVFESNHLIFSDTVITDFDFVASDEGLADKLQRNNEISRTSTALFDGIGEGLNSLINKTTPLKVLIVATDGGENSSTLFTDKSELFSLAQKEHIPIVIIGSLLSDVKFMKEVAKETGGIYFYGRSLRNIKAHLKPLANLFRSVHKVTINKKIDRGHIVKIHNGEKTIELEIE